MEGSSATMPINKRSQDANAEVPNEEPNAKIIKISEEAANNLDPLVHFSRFIDIPEMILNHLNAKDLIKFSEVSPLWYNVSASLKVLMENIKIVFNENRKLQMDYDLLKNSLRKYQNIEVIRRNSSRVYEDRFTEFNCISDLELDFFLSKAHDWKSVSIVDTNFRRKLDLYNFLSSIESSVESFSVRSRFGFAIPFEDGSSSNTNSFKVLKFPKLKHLRILRFHSMSVDYAEFLINSVAIERFDFEDTHGVISTRSILTKMLENFDKLTSLTLIAYQCDLFEDQTWKRFQFKLKSLALRVCRNIELLSTNLWQFINSQKVHLEELSIRLDNDIELFNNVMRLPKLKILHLGGICFNLSENVVSNVISTSITHLKSNHVVTFETFKFLMKSMPNVRSLYLSVFNQNYFRALIETKRKFEELKAVRLIDVKEKDLKVFLINENDKSLVENWKSEIFTLNFHYNHRRSLLSNHCNDCIA